MKSLAEYLYENFNVSTYNVLYIHGFGSDKFSTTGKHISNILKNSKVYTETFDLLNPKDTLNRINDIIETQNIQLVIGSSLGGFYALSSKCGVNKIALNPCMRPSEQLPKLTQISEHTQNDFSNIENQYLSNIDNETRGTTYAVFADNDELFSYKSLYESHYGKRYTVVSGEHHLNESALCDGIHKAIYEFDQHHMTVTNLFEHFENDIE